MKWKNFCAAICAAMLINSTALSAGRDDSLSELRADEIDYDMDTNFMTAAGNVRAKNKQTKKSAENNVPSEVNADSVDYDMSSGVVTAAGNVLLKYGGTDSATGAKAMYNVNTQEAYLIGDVVVTREDLKITCDSLTNDGYGHMQADGNVHGVQTIKPSEKYPRGDTRTFTGEHVDYYPDDRKHVFIPTGGLLTGNDGNFTADQMEGWIDDEYYTGTGNVHIVNPPRELEAGGDRVDYYANDNGRAVLTGNAWAVQNNNTMRGNRLTVYLADDKAGGAAQSRTAQPATPHEFLTDKPFTN